MIEKSRNDGLVQKTIGGKTNLVRCPNCGAELNEAREETETEEGNFAGHLRDKSNTLYLCEDCNDLWIVNKDGNVRGIKAGDFKDVEFA